MSPLSAADDGDASSSAGPASCSDAGHGLCHLRIPLTPMIIDDAAKVTPPTGFFERDASGIARTEHTTRRYFSSERVFRL